MWFKTKINNIKEWLKYNTRTVDQRFWFVCSASFFLFMALGFLSLIIIMWKLFIFLLCVLLIIAVVTSPVWIWIIRGQK